MGPLKTFPSLWVNQLNFRIEREKENFKSYVRIFLFFSFLGPPVIDDIKTIFLSVCKWLEFYVSYELNVPHEDMKKHQNIIDYDFYLLSFFLDFNNGSSRQFMIAF